MKRVKCYDNGGESFDRYTVVFLKREFSDYSGPYWCYIAMSEHPCDPQGFGQHGETNDPDMSHCGKQIPFKKLPADCQKLVLAEMQD